MPGGEADVSGEHGETAGVARRLVAPVPDQAGDDRGTQNGRGRICQADVGDSRDIKIEAIPGGLFRRRQEHPDGGWYVREGDHREREDDKGKPLRKIAWALEATIATTARPPGAPPAHPNLAIGLALTRPGEDPGGTGTRVLASIAARGHKTGWLGCDRAYTQAIPERFHLPARALGYSPVMDYRGTSSASRQTPRAHSSWRAPGTAPRCTGR